MNPRLIASIVAVALILGVRLWLHQVRPSRPGPTPVVTPNGPRSGADADKEVRIGDPGAEDGPVLRLIVRNVRENQKRLESPPWFGGDAGDWTVFDCIAQADPSVKFSVAVPQPKKSAKSDAPIAWSRAAIWTPDHDAGARLIDLFAKTFKHDAPKRKSPQPLTPLFLPTAYLGDHLDSEGDGFSSTTGKGGWTATKWFIQNDGFDAEVFFNYNLVAGRAEFTEKDPEYRADLVGALAAGLRDGPRPPRSQEVDPNFSAVGPKVVDEKLLADTEDTIPSWSPAGKLLIKTCHDHHNVAFLIDPANPDQRDELLRDEGSIVYCIPFGADASQDSWLIQENDNVQPNSNSPKNTTHLWILHGKSRQKREITGPWGKQISLASDAPVSRDGRFAAAFEWIQHDEPSPQEATQEVLYIIRLRDGHIVQKLTTNKIQHVIGWSVSLPTRALLESGKYDDDVKHELKWLDPATGAAEVLDPNAARPLRRGADLSPGGKYRVKITPHEKLELTELAGGKTRTFNFFEDDKRFADPDFMEWAGADYISLHTLQGQALIDARTLKMSFPAPLQKRNVDDPSESHPTFDFSPDFHWAVRETSRGVMLGRISIQ